MRVLADESRVAELIDGLAQAVAEDMASAGGRDREPCGGWALVGIRSRGDVLARRLAQKLGIANVGVLDITLYRDDLSEASSQPVVRTTEISFPIDRVNVVLVDDVLMSGRSVRAALQSLMDLGRPRRVWLSVLVDRGGRELPIAPDHVGLAVGSGDVAEGELVEVKLKPTDAQDAIIVRTARAGGVKEAGSP